MNLTIYQNYNIFKANRGWTENFTFKWDSQKSKLKLLNYLSDKQNIDTIVDFEIQNFKEDQKGVDEATDKLTNILHKLSENSCYVRRKSFRKYNVK